MELVLQLKRLGNKRVTTVPYQLDLIPETLSELIKACVVAEVTKYNQRREEVQLMAFLSPQQIQEQAEFGKISLGDLENLQSAVVEKALEAALLAHQDGLFVVFIDGIEVKDLQAAIQLRQDTELVFIRLTFLAGRLG
ncbi:hypothetical protein [Sphingobacterium bambusae]|uniref:Uncharacterized protein n=1 Tax=Sphingobacterium bambusae TaxID=662858 RepID=A0ABW6BCR6_9SPHI|nr:hypothetical protein [Sphingobacterium bambusae]WPL48604.1 hypothetical protein SCB77_21890 [Sphingobacterium bambusae]